MTKLTRSQIPHRDPLDLKRNLERQRRILAESFDNETQSPVETFIQEDLTGFEAAAAMQALFNEAFAPKVASQANAAIERMKAKKYGKFRQLIQDRQSQGASLQPQSPPEPF